MVQWWISWHLSSRPCFLVQCTVTCGGGVQARTVQCQVHGKPSSGCALHHKPSVSQACNTNFCPLPEKKGTKTLIQCMHNWVLSKNKLSESSHFTFFPPQISHVRITSAGVTWCPSMESATTSSTASSAATPVQIQTYKNTKWLVAHREIAKESKDYI